MYALTPVNKQAAIIISQAGCTDSVLLSTREEIDAIVQKLDQRQNKIKEILGIKNKSQLKNRKYFRQQVRQNYKVKNKTLFIELLNNGAQINKMNKMKQNFPHKLQKLSKKFTLSQIFMNKAEEILPIKLFDEIKTKAKEYIDAM